MDTFKVGGALVAMGVVYGDIGTSPLYVMKAIIEGNDGLANVSTDFILGSVSLIFWTLTLLTTVKYVMIALNADNHGEGGIFSLYTLVKKSGKFLLFPAMIGGATLLADGVLTPAVTVTTAIEGLRGIPRFYDAFGNNQHVIVVITMVIIFGLFMIQRLGTQKVGTAFGPIMLGWFTFLGVMGVINFADNLSVLKALNPYYAFHLLVSSENKAGIFILGSVFLATTGAEALYSDLGHAGRKNIRVSWPYIKVCLTLNYFGQAAWLISVKDNPTFQSIEMLNPFFRMMPKSLTVVGVVFATLAAIIASQSLISGSYTLVSEAIKLRLLPRMKIVYPTDQKGQLYIPAVNTLLMIGCLSIVVTFRTSAHMESAYGLAITITMLMTTLLLLFYLLQRGVPKLLSYTIFIFFAVIESIFFISSATKFLHGGYVAVFMALVIFGIMMIWHRGNIIQERESDKVSLCDYKEQLRELSQDTELPEYQTNIVFLTTKLKGHRVGKEIMYSILDKRPKRAKVYWFVNVFVTDEPYTKEYYVDMMGTDYIVNVQLRLGFRMNQEVNVYLRQIVQELMEEGKLPKQPQKYSIMKGREVGDFAFVLIREELTRVTSLSTIDTMVMQAKLAIKKIAFDPARWFGLEYSDVIVEHVPLVIGEKKKASHLTQIQVDDFDEDDD
ncbi:KUP/HAK/KT family potassium transporter [Vagococcus carniphilus]|uniref:KUP/HAK/KT family potassium transporter n=1 Tax=Vagococcus carniphilus TaxID=218144 RepID=UPI002890A6AC|nr:KUP/HAK/KT family potassium transporter [Vagococcus carniphilus]MDT2831170.1 KUP/HAK/KT family potassium transporter [Vagococcus carniphilus]MDT2839671.1 KUP/HAK/KT family potassium transporter [Vagococcus carniphilus]MDT2848848.1 KUP/HAK/KT family potassium transporter [Vagococcus carniphilus]MDT2854140.1 KUP/HAK/KT family potassium transporter [Vagococcus carniphilus]